MSSLQESVNVLILFAHEDERWQTMLQNHLIGLTSEGRVTLWDIHQIPAGTNRVVAIEERLQTTSVILVLVSAACLASYDCEIAQALRRQVSGEVMVIPILLHPVDWSNSRLAHLQPLPGNGMPITLHQNLDAAFVEVVVGIRNALLGTGRFGAGGGLISPTHSDISPQNRRERELLAQRTDRERRLRALFADHSGFLQDRLESFVGRELELAEVRQCIDELLPTGGYLTITGPAGQGKSSVIARLVEKMKEQQDSSDVVAFHFIPLMPPPDYQVALLRNLMARLILKYHLSDLYLASESRAALCEGFPRVLKEIAEQGGREIIFIDGLDQLQTDQQTGLRDLSFLPQGPGNPPQGIVLVLGTRPNDTLRPLELLKPYNEYKLPDLSRADFDQILQHRGVTLGKNKVDSLYDILEKNALYLDLAAKELAARDNLTNQEVIEIIEQIADDPENLFSLTIDRLRQQKELWVTVVKPVLGLLLVTNEPLAREHIKYLLHLNSTTKLDGDQLNLGLQRLGGLIILDNQERYSLFHLKFRDHLRQDREHPKKRYVFDKEDEQSYHQRFVVWCELGDLALIWEEPEGNFIEAGRRSYTREHYISHLYYANDHKKLFRVLDEGHYGKAKVQHDPSQRSYALDLDLGRKAAASPSGQLSELIDHLVHLWRYTLLRCSLASRADNYPEEAFELMLLWREEMKALGLAELLTSQEYKVQIFALIAGHLAKLPGREREAMRLFARSEQVILSISKEWNKAQAQVELTRALSQAGLWQEAERVIGSIFAEEGKAQAQVELARALGQAGLWQEAERVIGSIFSKENKVDAQVELTRALSQAGLWQEAEGVIDAISSAYEVEDAEALTKLKIALSEARFGKDAERLINFISKQRNKANILMWLATLLRQARLWQEAKRNRKRAQRIILFTHYPLECRSPSQIHSVSALGQEEHWQATIASILDANKTSKADTLVGLGRALSEVGLGQEARHCWHDAERVISTISCKKDKAQALVELAKELSQAGLGQESRHCWQEVEQVVGTISHEGDKAGVLAELGRMLGEAGLWQEAGRVIDSISHEGTKAYVQVELARELSEAGLGQEARHYWQEAERVIGSVSRAYKGSKTEALAGLARVLSWMGLWQEAERVIGTIPHEEKKADVLAELARALSQVGLWQEAKRVIGTIPDEGSQAEALVGLGRALSEAGLGQEARHYWQEAERVIATISHEWNKARALVGLAGALGEAGIWRETKRVIGTIPDEGSKAEALVGLGRALSEVGLGQEARYCWKEAERVIVSISHKWSKTALLAELGRALSKAGLWLEVDRVIVSIPDEGDKANVQVELARELSEAELWQEAERVIVTIPDERSQAQAQVGLARALGEAGLGQEAKLHWQEAERVIDTISHEGSKTQALVGLARALGKAGHWQEAERVIDTISHKLSKAEALAGLARTLSQTGLWQEAERVIATISHESEKDNVLTKLVAALSQAGFWQETERIIGTISDKEKKVQAFYSLVTELAQHSQQSWVIHIIQREWLNSVTRDDALNRFSLVFRLIPSYPDLGMQLYETFAWVDRFLQG